MFCNIRKDRVPLRSRIILRRVIKDSIGIEGGSTQLVSEMEPL